MRDLASVGIVAGETGAAALAGLNAIDEDDGWKQAAGDLSRATVLLIVTEGATDPDNYAAIVGRGHDSVGRVFTAIG